MASSPTSRTLLMLRALGYDCAIVEKYVRFNPRDPDDMSGIRKDMFGFADIVCLRPDIGIVAVQCTSGAHHADHKIKILLEPLARKWVECKGRIILVSWTKKRKRNKDGKPAKRESWVARKEEIEFPERTD